MISSGSTVSGDGWNVGVGGGEGKMRLRLCGPRPREPDTLAAAAHTAAAMPGVRDAYILPFVAGHGAPDEDAVQACVNLEHLQAQHGAMDAAHVSGHALALPHLARRAAAAGGAHGAVHQADAVRRGVALHAVLLHDALEALADTARGPMRRCATQIGLRAGRTYVIERTSTYWPGTKCAADSSVPAGSRFSGDTGNCSMCRFGGTPCLAKMPRSVALICLCGFGWLSQPTCGAPAARAEHQSGARARPPGHRYSAAHHERIAVVVPIDTLVHHLRVLHLMPAPVTAAAATVWC